jgi:hypothetical protein
LIGNFARGYGGNRNKRDGAYHDHVRGFLPLILRQASDPAAQACTDEAADDQNEPKQLAAPS